MNALKKEIIICFIVVALVITLDVISEAHTDFIMDDTKNNLGTLRQDLFLENSENIKNEIKEILDKWNDDKEILSVYIEHNELEKIETCLREINSNVETEEYNIAIQSLDTCVFLMNHIKDKYKLSIKNIF